MSSRPEQLLAEVDAMEKKQPFFGKKGHQTKTAEKMVRCANAFRAEREFVRAGEVYFRAAKLLQNLEDISGASDAAANAAKMFAKDPTRHTEAMDALHMGVDLFKQRKREMNAADLTVELAKILIEEGQTDAAVETMKTAASLYKEARAESKSASILEETADLLVDAGEYQGSKVFYQQVARMRLGNQLTQGSSGLVFFKAMLVSLQANDMVASKKELEEYLQLNPVWRRDFQCQFIMTLMEKIEKGVVEDFDEAVEQFKARCSLDKWTKNRILDLRKYADREAGTSYL